MASAGDAARALMVVLAGGPFLAACGGGLETGGLSLPAVQIPKVELPESVPPVVGTPTEVYTRVARGALNCWFGASGPLKSRYIYNAEAESPARGGKAEITIHERDPAAPDPRGPRAVKILVEPDGETAKVIYENQKLPADMAEAMRRDVDRWASGKLGCQPIPESAVWTSVTQHPSAQAAPAPSPGAQKGSR